MYLLEKYILQNKATSYISAIKFHGHKLHLSFMVDQFSSSECHHRAHISFHASAHELRFRFSLKFLRTYYRHTYFLTFFNFRKIDSTYPFDFVNLCHSV